MAVIETMHIDGAVVRVHDDYTKSREESEKILQDVADCFLRALNAQHNAKRFQELEKKEETAE